MKKAQVGIVAFIFAIFFFILVWFAWLGKWLGEAGEIAISTGHLTGIEAFVLGNLNLWVFIGLILGTMAFIYFGGGGR